MGSPEVETGDRGDDVLPRIAAAVAELEGVSELPLPEAATRLDALHGELQLALADLDRA